MRNELRAHCRKHGSSQPQRLLVLSDSRVCIGAVAKGRSSSFKLNGILRSLTSWLVLGDLSLGMLWVSTKANPADDPSRFVPLRRPTSPPSWASGYFERARTSAPPARWRRDDCSTCPAVREAAAERGSPLRHDRSSQLRVGTTYHGTCL